MGKRRPGKAGAVRKKAKRGGKKKAKKKAPKKKAAPKKEKPGLSGEAAAAMGREALKRALGERLAETKPGYRPCPRPEPAVMPVSSLRVARSAREEVGEIGELADSIRANGLLVPLVVSPDGEVLDGRRRLEALREIDITEVPVVIVSGDANGHVVEIVTNVMRKDLTPGERARAYRVAMQVLHLTQAKLGEMVGIGQAAVSKALMVLQPDEAAEGAGIPNGIRGENPPESPEEGPSETVVDRRKARGSATVGEVKEEVVEKRQAEREERGEKKPGAKREWFPQDKALLNFALENVCSLRVSASQVEFKVLIDAPEGERIGPALFEMPLQWRSAMASQCRSLRGMVLAQSEE